MTTKLERLLEKEAQLKAQIQQAKALERTLEKKRDTRRKILIGAAVMARVEHGDWPKGDLLQMMGGFLTRDHERDLFELDSGGADGTAEGARKKAETRKKKVLGKSRPQGDQAAKKAVKPLPEPAGSFDDDFDL